MKILNEELYHMKERINKSQKGAISVFVMLAMMFFLVTIMGIYMISAKRGQTQTESIGLMQEQYYTENQENEIYNGKIAEETEMIPIYTKEQLWSIGTGSAIEIEGKVYNFTESDLRKYELKNDIVINMETDLKNSQFKEDKIEKNNFQILYYYQGNYYNTINYSGKQIANGTAVLSASGENFSSIGQATTDLSGEYYLFGLIDANYGNTTLLDYPELYSNFDATNPITQTSNIDNYYYGNYKYAWSFWSLKGGISTNPILTSGTVNDYLTPVTAGINTNTFVTPVKNDWITVWWRAIGATTDVNLSHFLLEFSDTTTQTIQEAVDSGYIEPLVIYSSGMELGEDYTWHNIGEMINGGATENRNYPQAILMLKVSNKIPLTGITFETNRDWVTPNDGFVVRLMKDVELSTQPFTAP